MKKVLAVLVMAFLANPARAGEWILFNAVQADGLSTPNVVNLSAENTCELKIDSAAGSVAVVSLYSSSEINADGTQKNPTLWFRATNPANADPDNHLGGLCPKYVGGAITGWNSGLVTVTLRSKK